MFASYRHELEAEPGAWGFLLPPFSILLALTLPALLCWVTTRGNQLYLAALPPHRCRDRHPGAGRRAPAPSTARGRDRELPVNFSAVLSPRPKNALPKVSMGELLNKEGDQILHELPAVGGKEPECRALASLWNEMAFRGQSQLLGAGTAEGRESSSSSLNMSVPLVGAHQPATCFGYPAPCSCVSAVPYWSADSPRFLKSLKKRPPQEFACAMPCTFLTFVR